MSDFDKELAKILGEANAFTDQMEQEVKKNLEDIERVATVNTGRSDIVKTLRETSDKTKASVRKEVTVIEESIPKTKKDGRHD